MMGPGAWDVVIAGGGPAGAVCAIELARRDRRVLVLEAETPPRYRIGESVSPAVCEVLGSYGIDPDQHGFVVKPGATFAWGARAPYATYYAGATGWQVRRDVLDAALLDRARAEGAEVRTGCRVTRVLFSGDQATGVSLVTSEGFTSDVGAAYVIDATGRATLLGRQRGLLEHYPDLDRHAIWAYWEGGRELPDRAAGNSLYIGGRPAWWYLPVDRRADLVGVGLIGSGPLPDVNVDAAYASALDEVPILRDLLGGADRSGPVRSESCPAYLLRQVSGPGWLAVGDAAAFVDPVVTPGVQLAVESGQLAASVVHSVLEQPELAGPLGSEYQRRVARRAATFRRLAVNLFAAGTTRPADMSIVDLVGGDEEPDRATFLSVISGLPMDRLRPMLGGYLGMRGASVRYGGTVPVFGEAEGFGFLSWTLGRAPVPVPATTPQSRLSLADGAGIATYVLPSIADADVPRDVRAVHNAAGDRFLLTRELELLMEVLADNPSPGDVARRFAAAFGGAPEPDAVGRWLNLLAQNGIVAWRESTHSAEARV